MRLWMILASVSLALFAGCDKQSAAPGADTVAPAGAVKAPDLARGKTLAGQCATCHGEDGNAARNGAPFLAGQHQDYLYSAMQEYRDGTRKHDEMRKMVGPMTPYDLVSVAAYFAGQPAQWKGKGVGVPAVPKPDALKPDWQAIAAGRAAATACAGCHGEDGRSRWSESPSLAGLPPNYFGSALRAYFTGGRHDPNMAMFSRAVTDRDISNLAAYYFHAEPRRMNAPVAGDVEAGRSKAAPCAGCHGADGNSLSLNFPSLTGHGATYLAKAIADYKNGKRRSTLMRSAVARLSHKDIQDLAAYYARQTPVRIGARVAKTGGDPLQQGAQLAASCDGCHGPAGNSRTLGTPSLTGLSVRYLVKATKDYRDGKRKHELMRSMVETLTDLDIEKVSFHYALQQPDALKKSYKGDAAAGARIGASCDGCHGPQGNSADAKNPTLAGQDPVYMAAALAEYASGARPEGVMQSPAAALKPEDIRNVVLHYSQQTPAPFKTRAIEATQSLAQRCDRCHGENGRSTQADKPRLAGQAEGYLLQAMAGYQAGTRKHSAMHSMTEPLSLIEIHAIADHYSRQ